MKDGSQVRKLLQQLSRDPRVKRVISKAKRRTREKGRAKVETVTDTFLLLMAIASRFAKKKKARALDDLMEIIYLLVQVSLLLKENIFDRPEVKGFFRHSSKQIYVLAQECVAMVLPKTKGVRPMRTSRSA